MSDANGRHGRSLSDEARALWLLFWFLRNVVVFVFLTYPGAIFLVDVMADNKSYGARTSVMEAVIQGSALLWGLTLPWALPLAVAFSAIVVVGLSLVLSGRRLRLAATASLVAVAAWVALYPFALGVAQGCVFSACAAAYGWFCAIPPRAIGARARWEAVVVNGALAVSLAMPAIVLLLVVPIASSSH